ncbi:MAG: hypothetical protein R3D98_14915 [Candidatus Krumholzibacteriia bacterium]
MITADLVLLGAGARPPAEAPLDMPHTSARARTAVISAEAPATSVVVSGLTIDGLGRLRIPAPS